jgi:colicin import membrane protein
MAERDYLKETAKEKRERLRRAARRKAILAKRKRDREAAAKAKAEKEKAAKAAAKAKKQAALAEARRMIKKRPGKTEKEKSREEILREYLKAKAARKKK